MPKAKKNYLLSNEVSRGRALLAGGAATQEVLGLLRQWGVRAPKKGSRRAIESLLGWNDKLVAVLSESLPLGSPVGRILKESQSMIKREERLWLKLQGLERQYALQASIALVLPWAVAAFAGDISLNFYSILGFVFQVIGVLFFLLIVKSATKTPVDELTRVFDLLVSIWMRSLAGVSLHSSIEVSVRNIPHSNFASTWKNWLTSFDSAGNVEKFDWPSELSASRDIGALLGSLLRSGAPASETLSDFIGQIDDERQAALEDRIGSVPTRLSLAFCAFFAPAVFFILMGALWPTLQEMNFL